MGIVKSVVISALVAASQVNFAGTMGSSLPRFYLGIEGGDSISTNTHFQPRLSFIPSETYFLNAPVNSDFTRDIG